MADLNFLNFAIRNDYVGGGAALVDLQIEFVGQNLANPVAGMLAPQRADLDDHVLFRLTGDDAQKTG